MKVKAWFNLKDISLRQEKQFLMPATKFEMVILV
jgi:hypothetical protein